MEKKKSQFNFLDYVFKMRGLLRDYIDADFEQLGTLGYQIIQNAIAYPEVHANNVYQEYKNLKTKFRVDETRLLQQYGFGQTVSAWNARIATRPVWEKLFKTKDLLSSWDGASIVEPESQVLLQNELNTYNEPNWLHRDQRIGNTNLLDTIQGYLSLSDGCEKSYSTVLYVPKH
jgi:hypothetical protein